MLGPLGIFVWDYFRDSREEIGILDNDIDGRVEKIMERVW